MPALRFAGTAHPPAGSVRGDPSDLDNAEIDAADLGRRGKNRDANTPVLLEHEGGPVGRVLASWRGPQGQLRVRGLIDSPEAASDVRSGRKRGISIGMNMAHEPGDKTKVKVRSVGEVSVVEFPRRTNCYIDEVDGRNVTSYDRASAKRTRRLALGLALGLLGPRTLGPSDPRTLPKDLCRYRVIRKALAPTTNAVHAHVPRERPPVRRWRRECQALRPLFLPRRDLRYPLRSPLRTPRGQSLHAWRPSRTSRLPP